MKLSPLAHRVQRQLLELVPPKETQSLVDGILLSTEDRLAVRVDERWFGIADLCVVFTEIDTLVVLRCPVGTG